MPVLLSAMETQVAQSRREHTETGDRIGHRTQKAKPCLQGVQARANTTSQGRVRMLACQWEIKDATLYYSGPAFESWGLLGMPGEPSKCNKMVAGHSPKI